MIVRELGLRPELLAGFIRLRSRTGKRAAVPWEAVVDAKAYEGTHSE